jgi:hypothetical protein
MIYRGAEVRPEAMLTGGEQASAIPEEISVAPDFQRVAVHIGSAEADVGRWEIGEALMLHPQIRLDGSPQDFSHGAGWPVIAGLDDFIARAPDVNPGQGPGAGSRPLADTEDVVVARLGLHADGGFTRHAGV